MATAQQTDGATPPPAAAAMIAVKIPKIEIGRIELTLVGDSPLIVHAWSQKAKQQLLGKQMKLAKAAKEAKNPDEDFLDSMYWLTPRPAKVGAEELAAARFGFPAVAFKAAAVGACRYVDAIKMTEARGAFHVQGELIEIKGRPKKREDMVRIAMGTADIRFRGEFDPWAVTLVVAYNTAALSPEQIVNLFNVAGFGVGVGEWRPERDGQYGRFHVA